MEKKNDALEEKVGHLYEELELVDFYVRVFEDGLDTRDVMAKYYEAKDKIQELEKELKTKTLQYER